MEDSIILQSPEIEGYFESLQPFEIPNIGSPRWFQQQERIYNLSLQAALDVKANREEIIRDHVVTFNKGPILIHELIGVEIWRLNIFPLIMERITDLKSTIPVYMVLYYEVTLVSLLETVLYHEDVLESVSEVLIDLIDYCYRKIISLSSLQDDNGAEQSEKKEEEIHLLNQKKHIDFESGMKCISLFSYMTQHLKILPLSALHRLLVIHDIPLLFTKLVENPPWEREINGKEEKYFDGNWIQMDKRDTVKLNKTEGQVWIALIQLLLSPECQQKYEVTEYKKNQLLKLRSKLNEVLFDQIPILKELLRYLEHLRLFDAPVPKSGIVIEQVPEIWEFMQNKYTNKWKIIASNQMKGCFSLTENELYNFCKRLTNSLDLNNIEATFPGIPLCPVCGQEGLKRCSRCKNEWYCGRVCQVSHWSKHKSACELMTEEI